MNTANQILNAMGMDTITESEDTSEGPFVHMRTFSHQRNATRQRVYENHWTFPQKLWLEDPWGIAREVLRDDALAGHLYDLEGEGPAAPGEGTVGDWQ